MYYIQRRDANRTWSRDEQESYETALDALEACDRLNSEVQDHNRSWDKYRVVDDDANVITYGERVFNG